jgi:hypothetical protein
LECFGSVVSNGCVVGEVGFDVHRCRSQQKRKQKEKVPAPHTYLNPYARQSG